MVIGPGWLRRGIAPAAAGGIDPDVVDVRMDRVGPLPEPPQPVVPPVDGATELVATPAPPDVPAAEPAAEPRQWFWPDLAVGVTVEAVAAAAAVVVAARQAAARTASKGPDRATRLGGQARQRVTVVVQRGAAERVRGRQWVATLVDAVGTAVATSSVVNRVVDLQINRVLRPLVSNVLDDVLALLEAEPERVRSLVRDQREGIVDDIVAHIRASATIGDVTVDRWTARILRRRPASPP